MPLCPLTKANGRMLRWWEKAACIWNLTASWDYYSNLWGMHLSNKTRESCWKKRKKVGGKEREGAELVYDALQWSEEKYPFIFMRRQNSPLPFFFLLSNSSCHRLRNMFPVLLFKKRIKSPTQNKQHILRGNDAPVMAHKKEKLTNIFPWWQSWLCQYQLVLLIRWFTRPFNSLKQTIQVNFQGRISC